MYEMFGVPDELHNDLLGEVDHMLRTIFGDKQGSGGAIAAVTSTGIAKAARMFV